MKLTLIFFWVLFLPSLAHAGQTIVAVAANFTQPAKDIAKIFEKKTGNGVTLSFGATGSFYTQIKNGAPYEVFLAADAERTQKLRDEGFGVSGTEFTYAIGKLVLWSAKANIVTGVETLDDATIQHIAFCNPDAAPYGRAAVETMQTLKKYQKLAPKLVEGHNIAQAFQFVKTGNAEIGFVALSQVINEKSGSQWLVPQQYYQPIKQNAILLKKGKDNKTANDFLLFLKTDEAKNILQNYGYDLPKLGL